MKNINKIETMIEGWLKPLPHIPAKWSKMLADNLWWIVGIGIVLTGIALLMALGVLFAGLSFLGGMSGYGALLANVYTGWWMAAAVISMAIPAVSVVLMGMAFNPLKAMQKKGWNLLFLASLVTAAAQILSVALNFNYVLIFSLIMTLAGVAVGIYLLFEIKSYFKSGKIAAIKDKK